MSIHWRVRDFFEANPGLGMVLGGNETDINHAIGEIIDQMERQSGTNLEFTDILPRRAMTSELVILSLIDAGRKNRGQYVEELRRRFHLLKLDEEHVQEFLLSELTIILRYHRYPTVEGLNRQFLLPWENCYLGLKAMGITSEDQAALDRQLTSELVMTIDEAILYVEKKGCADISENEWEVVRHILGQDTFGQLTTRSPYLLELIDRLEAVGFDEGQITNFFYNECLETRRSKWKLSPLPAWASESTKKRCNN